MQKQKRGDIVTQVQKDQQWITRCKMEELNLVDSFAGPKARVIANMKDSKTYFYGQPERMDIEVLKQAEETKHVLCNDNLDSVSRVSAMTPKTDQVTYISNKSKKTEADKVSSVSKASKVSQSTTQSTRQRMEQLEAELAQEKERRIKAE